MRHEAPTVQRIEAGEVAVQLVVEGALELEPGRLGDARTDAVRLEAARQPRAVGSERLRGALRQDLADGKALEAGEPEQGVAPVNARDREALGHGVEEAVRVAVLEDRDALDPRLARQQLERADRATDSGRR